VKGFIINKMKRRYRRKPKRTFRRAKRTFRKRTFRRVKKYDGVVKRKIVQIFEVVAPTEGDTREALFCVNWNTHTSSTDTTTATYPGQAEFIRYMDLHKDMMVKGVKMTF